MALQAVNGGFLVGFGPSQFISGTTLTAATAATLDAANEAAIMVGQIFTSDGGSHTLNTTGSSSIFWRTGSVVFANGGTTVKVGLAAVDATTGPTARAANTTNVIDFDVSASFTGGGGGITGNASQNHVPDTGTKTIAHGDMVAFAVQMTARAGADSVIVQNASGPSAPLQRPVTTSYVAGSYTNTNQLPNVFITFADGATGWFYASDIFTTINTRTWNSGSAQVEYGQLYKLPFPTKIYGIYGFVDPDADFDVVLYSDPLGTPAAERTVSFDANVVAIAQGRRFTALFTSPYTVGAQQAVAAVLKPGASNISTYYKTLDAAGHRAADAWGTEGYGISRASGAFADSNSSLDHYYIGLLVGAFEHGVQPTYVLGI